MSKRRIHPLAGAAALTALLGASGQAPPTQAPIGGQSSVEAAAPQAPTTRTSPAPTQTVTRTAERIGKGGHRNWGQAWSVKRQARRALERMGALDSGRQWKGFRRLSRTDADLGALWQVALEIAERRIATAKRAA